MSEHFFTDADLRERWKCSDMTLWRLRDQGKLPPPVKIGGIRRNLTPIEVALKFERGAKG